jgi:predicted RNA binding protein YcfA (HicA-like mRNA interferase family)
MNRLPRLTGKEIIIALHKAGFIEVRIKGSHHFPSILMVVSPLFHPIPAKQLAPD